MADVQFLSPTTVVDQRIHYVTALARYQNRWVFARHHQRQSWDMPGGHREPEESPMEAMRRELWEETGAQKAVLHEICAYMVNWDDKCGMLYYADIQELGPLPEEFEMAELLFTDSLPESITYPEIYPDLYHKIQAWLNLQSSANELWDVYDGDRNLTGRFHRRGDPMKSGDYHLVVHVWIQNSDGNFLLTKRSPTKGFPNMWETTGGSALAGDDSLTAALREVKEETGLSLDPSCGERILTKQKEDFFRDVWLFRQDFSQEDVILQPGETIDQRCACKMQILQMYRAGELVPYDYLAELFSALDNGAQILYTDGEGK